jgi:hypothetical protein
MSHFANAKDFIALSNKAFVEGSEFQSFRLLEKKVFGSWFLINMILVVLH